MILGLTLFHAPAADAARVSGIARIKGATPRAWTKADGIRDRHLAGLMAQGLESIARKEYPKAIELFERVTGLDPTMADAFARLGQAQYLVSFQKTPGDATRKNDLAAAVDSFQTALALDPGRRSIQDPYLVFHSLAMAYEGLGRDAEAISALKSAARVSPADPMPALYMARIHFRLGAVGKSSDELHRSVLLARRARTYPKLARLLRSDPIFASLAATPPHPAILETYDRVKRGKLNEREARERVEELLSFRDAPGPGPRLPMGSEASRHFIGGLLSGGLAPRPPIEGKPGAKMPEPKPVVQRTDPGVRAHLDKADTAFRLGRFRRAIAEYEETIAEDQNQRTLGDGEKSRILVRISVAYRHLGLAEEAIAELERGVQDLPQSGPLYYQLSLNYSAAGRFSLALGALELALKKTHAREDLRKMLLTARTDTELDPLRDLPSFEKIIGPHSARLQAKSGT